MWTGVATKNQTMDKQGESGSATGLEVAFGHARLSCQKQQAVTAIRRSTN